MKGLHTNRVGIVGTNLTCVIGKMPGLVFLVLIVFQIECWCVCGRGHDSRLPTMDVSDSVMRPVTLLVRPLISSMRSSHNCLEMNKNMTIGPYGSRNTEWLCWWRPTEIYPTNMHLPFSYLPPIKCTLRIALGPLQYLRLINILKICRSVCPIQVRKKVQVY